MAAIGSDRKHVYLNGTGLKTFDPGEYPNMLVLHIAGNPIERLPEMRLSELVYSPWQDAAAVDCDTRILHTTYAPDGGALTPAQINKLNSVLINTCTLEQLGLPPGASIASALQAREALRASIPPAVRSRVVAEVLSELGYGPARRA